jgi:hypothetical protein
LVKERFSLDKEVLSDWKQSLAELDSQYKDELSTLELEYWFSTRKLAPRLLPLGRDPLGNTLWMFSTRGLKTRDFGTWIVLQTPENKTPSGEPITHSAESDGYSDLPSWYFLESLADVDSYREWIEYTLRKQFKKKSERRISSAKKRSPNPKGQRFAVEILEKHRDEYNLRIAILSLTAELTHARAWLSLKSPQTH